MGNWQLAMGNRQLAMGNGQFAMGNRQFAMGNRQFAMGNRQFAMGNRQFAMGNRQFAMGNLQWAICNLQWAIGEGIGFFNIIFKFMGVRNFKDTKVYQKAFDLAMEIFRISSAFPKEERYSLTDQIRRSSRSVCANLAEAYRRRQYPAHFLSKISDCDAENSETGVWLDFTLSCRYVAEEVYSELVEKNNEVGRLLSHMLRYPERY